MCQFAISLWWIITQLCNFGPFYVSFMQHLACMKPAPLVSQYTQEWSAWSSYCRWSTTKCGSAPKKATINKRHKHAPLLNNKSCCRTTISLKPLQLRHRRKSVDKREKNRDPRYIPQWISWEWIIRHVNQVIYYTPQSKGHYNIPWDR